VATFDFDGMNGTSSTFGNMVLHTKKPNLWSEMLGGRILRSEIETNGWSSVEDLAADFFS